MSRRIIATGAVIWLFGLGVIAALLLRVDTKTVRPWPSQTTCGDARDDDVFMLPSARDALLEQCRGLPDAAKPNAYQTPYDVTEWVIPTNAFVAFTAVVLGLTFTAAVVAGIWRRSP